MIKSHFAAYLTAVVFIFPVLCFANKVEPKPAFFGTVTEVIDGDTFWVRYENTKLTIKIRLHVIDAPERGEPGWKASKDWLPDLIGGKKLELYCVYTDCYGRKICKALLPRTLFDIGLSMVRLRFAVVDEHYLHELSPLDQEDYVEILRQWI